MFEPFRFHYIKNRYINKATDKANLNRSAAFVGTTRIKFLGQCVCVRSEGLKRFIVEQSAPFVLLQCIRHTIVRITKNGWLVGCFGFNGSLEQYFSLCRAVSQREREREEKRKRREKMSKQLQPTASAIAPCPTIIQTVERPGTGSLPGPSHHSTAPGLRGRFPFQNHRNQNYYKDKTNIRMTNLDERVGRKTLRN